MDREGISLSVGNVLSLDIALPAGDSSQTINVTEDAPFVENKSITLAQVVSSKEVTDLPLNGRNYLDAANLVPGGIPTAAGRDNSFTAYGNTGLQNAFLLDGARNVNYLRGLDNGARDMVRPPLDALREFTVQTSNYSAEFGSSAGGVVNAITKSGTNALHGSAYDFFRNDHLDAQNYFAPTKPLLVKNQYGGSLGGKIIRDKAWYFGAHEGINQRDENPGTANVPTALERVCDFSKTKNSSGAVIPIFDPDTTSGSGTTATRVPFANSVLPASRLDAITLKLANYFPLPNSPGLGVNVYSRNAPERIDNKNGIGRVDLQFSPKQFVFGRYAQTQVATSNEAVLPLPASNPGAPTISSKGIGAGYTRIITDALINEFRYAWTTVAVVNRGTQARDEVIPGSLDTRVVSGLPVFSITNYGSIGGQSPAAAIILFLRLRAYSTTQIMSRGHTESTSPSLVVSSYGFALAQRLLSMAGPLLDLPGYLHRIPDLGAIRVSRWQISCSVMRTN